MGSAEVGPGVAEALVAGPEGSGVQPNKSKKRTEGGAGSIDAGTGVLGVVLQTGRTGTNVWWLGTQGDGTGTEEGSGSPLKHVLEQLYF